MAYDAMDVWNDKDDITAPSVPEIRVRKESGARDIFEDISTGVCDNSQSYEESLARVVKSSDELTYMGVQGIDQHDKGDSTLSTEAIQVSQKVSSHKPPRPSRPPQSPARCRIGTTATGGKDFDADERELIAIDAAKDMFLKDATRSPGSNEEMSYTEDKYNKYVLETASVERPRSTTPINLATFTDYIRNGAANDNTDDAGKIKITLPKDEYSSRSKNLRKTDNEPSSPWSDFQQNQLFGNTDDSTNANNVNENQTVLFPRSKRQAPTPLQKSRPPPVPPPPSKTALDNRQAGWETFDSPLEANIIRPKSPSLDENDEEQEPHDFKDGQTSTAGPTMSSFDEESVLFDPASPTEKKQHKYKGLSPRRIRGILDGGQKKQKKEKKDRTKEKEAFARFTSEESKTGEKSNEWASFQQMQDRIKSTVLMTQAKISRLETGFEEELEKLATSAQSPWMNISGDMEEPPAKETLDPKTSWEGFDDNFTTSPNIELSKNLAHLTVTPIGSPRQTPLPPHNSRRGSTEDSGNDDSATCREADLLGLTADYSDKQQAPVSDLLGDINTTEVTGSSLAVDFLSLSRNEAGSALSSGCSTPVDTNLSKNADQSNLGTSIVDEFLGIGSDQDASIPTALQDPLEMLELCSKKKEQSDVTVKPADTGFNPLEDLENYDDDTFGLGFAKDSAKKVTSSPVKPNMDLFMFEHDAKGAKEFVDGIRSPLSDEFDPRADLGSDDKQHAAIDDNADFWSTSAIKSQNPFRDSQTDADLVSASGNPFTSTTAACGIPFIDDGDMLGGSGDFNPFATITEDAAPIASDTFNPFQTIHDDDAFEVHFPDETDQENVSPTRFNPFDKEPPLDEKFASFQPNNEAAVETSQSPTADSSFEEEEDLPPFEPFRTPFEKDGWQMMLRQPAKKKLTHNRFWKPVYVRLGKRHEAAVLQVYRDENSTETLQELVLQSGYNLCNMGLQTYDQFGKCHTVKIQYIFYRERVGVKAERVTPTFSDLTRVRDLKSLRDLVHKPKATMILDHAPQASELLKFGSLNYQDFCSFIWQVEDALFRLPMQKEKNTTTYSKDEITIDIVDEYFVQFDVHGHKVSHKARVRMFCLSFLSGSPVIEVGINDKRRQGKEVVGRQDIIPIKTEQWIRIYEPEFHASVNMEEYNKSRVIKLCPQDASQFEMMRFRVHPKFNKELPLQIQVKMSVVDKHVEIRAEIIIPGYHSNSRRAAQTPCEDIQVRFPLPEEWIYLLRVEKRFRYGSLKSSTRKPGKIKGFERLSMIAQGMLPASLIEVSTGLAKYEHVYRSIVWRISQLPERNQGAYKTHLFALKLDLGPHDVIPDSYDLSAYVEYRMMNSTVSRAQVRSISIETDTEPDKWVHHVARYEYQVAIDFTDQPDAVQTDMDQNEDVTSSLVEEEASAIEESDDSDTSDSD